MFFLVYLLDSSYTNILAFDSNVVTTFFFDSLTAGQYILRSLDTTGCYADTMITISEGIPLGLDITNDTIICLGGTATIGVNAIGGTPPYSYNWENLSSSVLHVE